MSAEKEVAGSQSSAASSGEAPGLDTGVAHSARVHDYWLGGKENYAADRAAGDAVIAAYPGIVMSVRANTAFLARVVRFLAAEAGIRQFLDIGTGIPSANNTHEVAQAVAPDARVGPMPGSSASTSQSRRGCQVFLRARTVAAGSSSGPAMTAAV